MDETRQARLAGGEEEEEDDDEELEEARYKHTKDAILFVVSVSQSMLTIPPNPESKKVDGDSALLASLKCAYELMTQRIISNPNDMMGILLYGTEKTNFQDLEVLSSRKAYANCYLLVDLGIPSAEDVKTLKSLIEDREEFEQLMIPCGEPANMADVLFCAQQILITKAANFTSKRIFIVTDDDDPHAHDNETKSLAAIRAYDLYWLEVEIELFPVAHGAKEFDQTKFYNDIIYSTESRGDESAPTIASTQGISLLNSLLSAVKSRAVAKRALFANLPLEIGPGLKISVKGYIIFKRQELHRTTYVWLKDEKAQIAKVAPNKDAKDAGDGSISMKAQKGYKFGGEQIIFTTQELSDLRNFGEPVIRVIGFKDIGPQTLPIWANLKAATFIYPSEEDYVCSTRVFSALRRKMLKDGKMATAWFIARKNAAPQIVAIVSADERLDSQGNQKIPPGMWLIPLPYADDLRSDPETPVIQVADILVDKMRKIIEKLRITSLRYNPETHPNPALQWHYRILQALALEETIPDAEEAKDKTRPRYKQILKGARSEIEDWGNELQDQYRSLEADREQTMTTRKRPIDKGSHENSKKRIKVGGDEIRDEEMRDRYDSNSINKLGVAEIKAWLATKGLITSGKKPALVNRVESWFEQKHHF